MDDPPYTAAEDDPFNIKPLLHQPRRRRSSMLNKWIQEQQQVPTDILDVEEGSSLPPSGTRSNPYLAYPELGSHPFHESVVSVNSYDMMDDDDIPPENEMPATPMATPSRRGSRLLQAPSSFRSFHIPFRSSSPASSLASSSGTTPRTPTLGLFFPRAPRSSTSSTHVQHTRSSSLSALNVMGEDNTLPPSSTTKSRWRPSVLGHFGMSSSQPSVVPTDTLHTRSRPSISSNHTYTTTTLTTTDGDMPITPPRSLAAESVQARSRSYGSMLKLADNASSYSLWSGPSYLDELSMPPRVPLGPKPARGSLPQIRIWKLLGSCLRNRTTDRSGGCIFFRKQESYTSPRLVCVSWNSADEPANLRCKQWCESFGEVSQITRMPNDDLHVNFRQADVADTVCRLRAKVYIRGVGSVQLSWYMGNGTENSR
ncbi:hypothetical protein B0H13DRAFT_1974176 [Mycena leptocephala]|nr:hypothetical protein B0H13DRAFT_1974176 [Mycena leptocephala]